MELHMIKNDKTYVLMCLGAEKGGPRFLNGVTENSHVNLAPDAGPGHSGAQWRAKQSDKGWQFVCLGKRTEELFYLNGRTVECSVELTKDDQLAGIVWSVQRHDAGVYHLKCQGNLPGPTYLNGVTAHSSVNLTESPGELHSGASWQFYELVD
jgi:hypothetical protein